MSLDHYKPGMLPTPANPDSAIVEMKKHMAFFERVKKEILTAEDVVVIEKRPYIKRSGWRKIQMLCNVSDKITDAQKEVEKDGSITWRIRVVAFAPNGREAEGIGSCNTKEKGFTHKEHDAYAIAHTRSKNRAIADLVGMAEVSAEEMQAMKVVK